MTKAPPPPKPTDASEQEDGKRYVHPVISSPGGNYCDPAMWVGFLPEPYNADPKVLVYMVPRDVRFQVYAANDEKLKGVKMTVAVFDTTNDDTGEKMEMKIPLQLTGKDFGNWVMQKRLVEGELQGRLHPVAFSGLLSEVPLKCTMSSDFKPLVVLYATPHEDMLDLTMYMTNLTKAAAING